MPNLMLDLRYLRCAMAVAELGSFRRAAMAMDLPQSSVSRRIQLLERRLGFPLFVRTSSGTHLTPSGDHFLKAAIRGARQIDYAARLASEIHKGSRGEVRVGVLAPIAGGVLHEVLRTFKKQHPDIVVSLQEGKPLEVLHDVATGSLDISFVNGLPDTPGCEAKVLWSEALFAVFPADHKLAQRDAVRWNEICKELFIFSRCDLDVRDVVIRRLSKTGFRPRIETHAVSRGSLLDLVAMKYGITLATASLIRRDGNGVIFRMIAGEAEVLPSSAVWSPTNSNPAVCMMLGLAKRIAGRVPRD